MKHAPFLMFLVFATTTADATAWSDLWLTHDQQAQRLLEAGQPAAAAKTFADPRRRAYAEIRAGQFADAAKRLSAFEDPESQYNRGNAMARGGDLKGALAAYERAIRRAQPGSKLDGDARHNRDLVARQLKQQEPSPATGPQDGRAQSDQGAGSRSAADRRQAQDGRQAAKGGSPAAQPQQQAQAGNSESPGTRDQQASAGGSKDTSGERHGGALSVQGAGEDANQKPARAQQAAQAAPANAGPEGAAQDQGRAAQVRPMAQGDEGRPAVAAVEQPPSEQTLALDQWLRQIPDDPAGLLRRKFLIEHMRKEQEAQR
jgi:Ca-activated chloride channel homolog